MDFEVLVNASILEWGIGSDISPNTNKFFVSLINDFEDGHWRREKFNDFVWDNIAETALSYRERAALAERPASLIRAAAQNLRLTKGSSDIGRGSELAEIFLYGVMRHQYRALPVVPKIFYKQNHQDNAKGADSVHLVLADDGFSLWLGEAKFFNSIEDARLNQVIESVLECVSAEKLRKENSIISGVSDLDLIEMDDSLRQEIRRVLSPRSSLDTVRPLLNIPILLLHECEITANTTSLTSEYKDSLASYYKDRATSYFKRQAEALGKNHGYELMRFHLILFPVPNKESLVEDFISDVSHQKRR